MLTMPAKSNFLLFFKYVLSIQMSIQAPHKSSQFVNSLKIIDYNSE
jgi:hypothetical protein